ncbi:GNAT family N-acetyltransferase [Sporofaciens sp. JLR.KK001]|uniref:GNAT family N-acetyltransferase n=1 Tax=Sporofaciens sp. JLR.KK001 TaxID=3112621 RepID=UPI002FF20A23
MQSIYYDENWAILQQEKEGGEAEIYQCQCSDCLIKYVFIKRKAGIIKGIQYYDILTPRGMGGPRIAKGHLFDLEKYNDDFLEYCKEKNIIAEYVRFDPWNRNYSIFGELLDKTEYYGNLYCNNLCGNFYKEEYDRNVIRNIKKYSDNIEVVFDFEGKEIDAFLELYKFTEEKYKVGNYYHLSREFLLDYFRLLNGKVAIANAIYQTKIISSAIVLFGEDIVHYHFLGNDPQYRRVYANTIIMYKIALLGQKMGKKLFDLGGGVIDGSTADYKRRFVNESGIYPYYVGKRILNKDIYEKLIDRNGKNRKGYFPEYKRDN